VSSVDAFGLDPSSCGFLGFGCLSSVFASVWDSVLGWFEETFCGSGLVARAVQFFSWYPPSVAHTLVPKATIWGGRLTIASLARYEKIHFQGTVTTVQTASKVLGRTLLYTSLAATAIDVGCQLLR
jgi:hypothetical protein